MCAKFKALVKERLKREFPQDPLVQLELARDAVFRSWNNDRAKYYRKANGIPDDIGTAVNVQAMVFGNMGNDCATGVGFTRNPATGAKEFYGEYLLNAQGEDVVAGIRTPNQIRDMKKELPKVFDQLMRITGEAREALQGRAGFRVHHRGEHPLHAPDAEREADRGGGRQDRRRHGEGEADHEGGGAPAPRAPADRPAASSGDRPEGEARRRRQGAAGLPRRRRPARWCSTRTRRWSGPPRGRT